MAATVKSLTAQAERLKVKEARLASELKTVREQKKITAGQLKELKAAAKPAAK